MFGGYYNHCSFTLDNERKMAYSFSRYYRQLWFTGCFCKEDISRYEDYVVFQIDISEKEYECIKAFINELSEGYKIYDYLSAALYPFGIRMHFRYHFICSTFVMKVLSMTDRVTLDKSPYFYSPMDVMNFLSSSDVKQIA
jgi:hypothetical protein